MNDIIQLIIFTIAGILHGITGMGFPMIGTSALSFSLPLSQAVAIVAIPSLLMSLLVLCSNNKQGIWRELTDYLHQYKLLAITSVIGGIIGVKLLLILPVAYLYLMMAVVTVYYAAHGLLTLMNKAKPLTVPTGKLSMSLFGLAAGMVGGATNAMSPILLIYLFSKTDDKTTIAKASNLCYLLGKVVQVVMLWGQYAAFDQRQYTLLGLLTIVSMLGLFGGIWLRAYISGTVFKLMIYLILLILALKIGHTGIIKFGL